MSGPGREERGQASVELALLLPLVALLALLVVQVAVIARDQVLVQHAAREAARAGAVSADPDADARRGAQASGSLDPDHLDVSTTVVGDRVRVTVTFHDSTDVAIVGPALPVVDLTASATMQREGP